MKQRRSEIILALDTDDIEEARNLAKLAQELVKIFKIGPILFISHGLKAMDVVKDGGGEIFLDLKLHDIPNTVKGGVKAACSLGVRMITLHLAGGIEMIKGAVDGAIEGSQKYGGIKPLLIGVTRLTSLSKERGLHDDVLRLSEVAAKSGIDGIVCSAQEVASVKQAYGDNLITVVPGIRLTKENKDDQARVATPEDAARAGADYIVVGRTVTRSSDPARALQHVVEGIENAQRS